MQIPIHSHGGFMNWDQIEGQWKDFKGQVREKWAKFTDSDLDAIGGKKDRLVGKLQQVYGTEKDKAERDVNQFLSGIDDQKMKMRSSQAKH
jgi:uncharacterized protein YjbJ (UPF0337 family)